MNVSAFKPLTKDDIGEVLGVSLRTIENWVNEGILPAPRKLGNRVYWHPNTFYGWLDQYLTAPMPECMQSIGSSVAEQAKHEQAKPKSRPQTKAGKAESEALRISERAKLEALLA
jgi:predicted DNA-binding transcriptional regulator AlpA